MKKKDKCQKRKQLTILTEPQIHRTLHQLRLAECKKWARDGRNKLTRVHD